MIANNVDQSPGAMAQGSITTIPDKRHCSPGTSNFVREADQWDIAGIRPQVVE